jgi:hypothetical protein
MVMNLTESETTLLIKEFPKFELSYELMTHKNVYNADIILAIPDGFKYFAWFTTYKGNNACFTLKLNEKMIITEIKQIDASFDDSLSKGDSLSNGSIFYGTMFKYNNSNCFCIEDLYYYKGNECMNMLYLEKIKLLEKTLDREISQVALTNKHIIFGLPFMTTEFNILLKEIQTFPYNISQIKYRFFNKYNSKKIMTMNYYKPKTYSSSSNNVTNRNNVTNSNNVTNRNSNIIKNDNIKNYNPKNNIVKKAIFKVTADIEPDIYNLFIYKNGVEEYYDTAFIPDYKTSVKMNQLFRKIKENENLDAIEESDDEEEFENNNEDKFVYLDKSFNMHCEYIHKFKRWCPVSLAGDNDQNVSTNLIN